MFCYTSSRPPISTLLLHAPTLPGTFALSKLPLLENEQSHPDTNGRIFIYSLLGARQCALLGDMGEKASAGKEP